MKLIGKQIDKTGAGHVNLRPEDDEDMWHLYNVIQVGDEVRAPAIRRVQNVSATGSTESHRIRLNLTIQVSRVDFSPPTAPPETASSSATADTSAPLPTATLHISGRVTSENQHVKLGAFHTLDITANRDIRIFKTPPTSAFDSIALARVDEACVPGRGAELAAVVLSPTGTATFCLLSAHTTIVTQRLSVPIPRKAASASQYERAMQRFYGAVYDAFGRNVPYAGVGLKAIVLASPGWVRDATAEYMIAEAIRRGDKPLVKALKEKVIRVHVNSAHVHSLVEVLKSPEIAAQLKETKFAREGIVLDKFFKMLGVDEMRAWYGPGHVTLAAERGAVGTLLISDELFRASDPKLRKKYVALVEDVKQKGAEVVMFSSMHESGQQLNQLTGIAAILTFPLDVEVVEAEEKEAREAEQVKQAEEGEGVDSAGETDLTPTKFEDTEQGKDVGG